MSPRIEGVALAALTVLLVILVVLFCPSFSRSAFIYVEF